MSDFLDDFLSRMKDDDSSKKKNSKEIHVPRLGKVVLSADEGKFKNSSKWSYSLSAETPELDLTLVEYEGAGDILCFNTPELLKTNNLYRLLTQGNNQLQREIFGFINEIIPVAKRDAEKDDDPVYIIFLHVKANEDVKRLSDWFMDGIGYGTEVQTIEEVFDKDSPDDKSIEIRLKV